MYRETQGRYFLSPEYPSQYMLRLLHVSLALFKKKILMMNFFIEPWEQKSRLNFVDPMFIGPHIELAL